jgi:hypothetical protein
MRLPWLLRCDASTTPPFTLGETLCLHDPATGENLGVFMVAQLTRQVPYRVREAAPSTRVALTGQEIRLEMRAVQHTS